MHFERPTCVTMCLRESAGELPALVQTSYLDLRGTGERSEEGEAGKGKESEEGREGMEGPQKCPHRHKFLATTMFQAAFSVAHQLVRFIRSTVALYK